MRFAVPFTKKKKPAEPAPQGYVPQSIQQVPQQGFQFTGTSLPMAVMKPVKHKKAETEKHSNYLPPAFRASKAQQKKRAAALMKEQPFAVGFAPGPLFAPIQPMQIGWGGAPPKSTLDKEGKLKKAYYY